MESVVTREVAENEFSRFVDAMDLDIEPETMTEEDRASFEVQRRRVIKAIESGLVVINDNGEPEIFTKTVDASSITFYEPTGASLMASDGKKKDDRVKQMYAIMADMTKQTPKTFAQMKRRELKVCEAIAVLFLG